MNQYLLQPAKGEKNKTVLDFPKLISPRYITGCFSISTKVKNIKPLPLYPERKYILHHPEIVVCFTGTNNQHIHVIGISTFGCIFEENMFESINAQSCFNTGNKAGNMKTVVNALAKKSYIGSWNYGAGTHFKNPAQP